MGADLRIFILNMTATTGSTNVDAVRFAPETSTDKRDLAELAWHIGNMVELRNIGYNALQAITFYWRNRGGVRQTFVYSYNTGRKMTAIITPARACAPSALPSKLHCYISSRLSKAVQGAPTLLQKVAIEKL